MRVRRLQWQYGLMAKSHGCKFRRASIALPRVTPSFPVQ